MTNAEAIESLRENYCCNRSVCELHSVDLCQKEKCEIWMAISALQAQEELYVYSQCKTCRYYHDDDVRCMICDDENDMYEAQEAKTQLSREDTTLVVQKTCITCKHYPPESKWPCIDCDMRNPADRWEPQELSKNSPELDKENGDLKPTCNQLAPDCISRQAALDALIALTVYSNKRDLVKEADNHPNTWIEGVAECIDEIEDLPSAQPEIKPISYQDCANAMMMMWIDDVLTDGEYRRIMDKLNDHESRRENR